MERLTAAMKSEIERNITVYGNPLLNMCNETCVDGDEDNIVYVHASGKVYTKDYLDTMYRNASYRNFTCGYQDVELGYINDAAEDCADHGVMYKLGMEYAKKDLHSKGTIIPSIVSHYLG